MSRKDTIIVALLVNAALLAVLFMLAINNDGDEKIRDQFEMTQPVAEVASPFQSIAQNNSISSNSVADEMDSLLKDMNNEELTQPIVIEEEDFNDFDKQISAPEPIAAAPQPSKETEKKSDESFVEVTVKRGDALERIARSNGTTVEAIKAANNLKSAKLSIGQVLRVPTNAKNVPTISATTPVEKTPKKIAANEPVKKPAEPSSIQYYTIKSGDNPWKIAKQFQVKFEDLLKMNDLDEERAKNLKIGDKIRVH